MAHLRGGDVLARWGGEEFVLLLCDTEPNAAAELLERVRSAVQAHVLAHDAHSIRITVSIGWARHERGESLEETLQRADQALYEAKHAGQNRVMQAQCSTTSAVPRPSFDADAADAANRTAELIKGGAFTADGRSTSVPAGTAA